VRVRCRAHGYVVRGTSLEIKDRKPDLQIQFNLRSSRISRGTYEGALVVAIKVPKELVDARLRDQVVLRERKALRIERSGLDKTQTKPRADQHLETRPGQRLATHDATDKLERLVLGPMSNHAEPILRLAHLDGRVARELVLESERVVLALRAEVGACS
jgi:hypothetical protein